MELTHTIYKITNLLSGRFYIGITSLGLKTRWAGHKTAAFGSSFTHSNELYKDLRKYGEESFRVEVVWQYVGREGKELAVAKEIALIECYSQRDDCWIYNMKIANLASYLSQPKPKPIAKDYSAPLVDRIKKVIQDRESRISDLKEQVADCETISRYQYLATFLRIEYHRVDELKNILGEY